MSTLLKYWLIQLPGIAALGAVLWWAQSSEWISAGWALGVLAGWIATDVAFYPLTRDAYRGGAPRHGPQVGQVGVVRKALNPSGTVFASGALWNAKLDDPTQSVESGEAVRVVECRGLLLIVARDRANGTA